MERVNQQLALQKQLSDEDAEDENEAHDAQVKVKGPEGKDEHRGAEEKPQRWLERMDSRGVLERNGLVLHPDGAKEAYLKALEAAQFAQLQSLKRLQDRLTRPYVFSYFDPLPWKRERHDDGCACGVCNSTMPRKSLRLQGRQPEMRHIFGKIDPNDYYPGQKLNPIRPRKTGRSSGMEQWQAERFMGLPKWARVAVRIPPVRSHPDHEHVNKVATGTAQRD